MSIRVKGNGLGVSAKKTRVVANLIRNKTAMDALKILRFCEKREISLYLFKLVNSGLAIAENKGSIDMDRLILKEVLVDEGVTIKRIMPRAQGRAFRINKRSCNITIGLKEA